MSAINQGAPAPAPSSPQSFENKKAAILAVDPRMLVHINLNVMLVVTTVIGCYAKIRALRDALVATLNDFNALAFDGLLELARAVQHIEGLYIQATKAPDAVQSLVAAATELRDRLLADALALAGRGHINPESIREVKRSIGHRPLILDLQVLVATFRQVWSDIAGLTAVKAEELEEATALIDMLTEAIGTREHSRAKTEDIKDMRRKGYALLLATYDDIRDGVIYIRRHTKDEDDFMPSLHTTRPNGSKQRAEPEPAPVPENTESEGAPSASGVMSPVTDEETEAAKVPFKRS